MLMRLWLVCFLSLGCVAACNASDTGVLFKEGVNYKIIKPAGKTAQAEVVEFFSYGCPHCFEAESVVHEWHTSNKTVVLKRVAVVGFRPDWDILAKTYYTAEVLGVTEKMHLPMFKLIHEQKKPPTNDEAIAEFLSQFGVTRAQVMGTLNSFVVSTQMNEASQRQKDYRISSVPTFVVNDKYITDVPMAGSFEAMPHILNFLAKK